MGISGKRIYRVDPRGVFQFANGFPNVLFTGFASFDVAGGVAGRHPIHLPILRCAAPSQFVRNTPWMAILADGASTSILSFRDGFSA